MFSSRVHVYLQRLYSSSCKSSRAIPTFSFKRASLKGLLGRTDAAVMGALELESAIVKVVYLGVYGIRQREVNCNVIAVGSSSSPMLGWELLRNQAESVRESARAAISKS